MSGGYTPLFASIVTGTLYGRWPDIGLWPIVLAIADRHGLVDVTPHYLAGATGLPVDDVIACMKRFCEPDPYSRSKADGGSRLVLLDDHRDWGWQVVNHSKYREKARKASYDSQRTESGIDAERKRASRDVPTSPAMSRAVPLSDSDSYTNKDKTKNLLAGRTPPHWFEEFKQVYPKRAGDQQWRKAISAGNARIAEGHQPTEFIGGAARYAVFITATGKGGTEFVQQAARFLGPGKPFLLPWNPPAAAETATEEIKRLNSGGSHETGRVFEAEPSRTGLVPLFGNVRR